MCKCVDIIGLKIIKYLSELYGMQSILFENDAGYFLKHGCKHADTLG